MNGISLLPSGSPTTAVALSLGRIKVVFEALDTVRLPAFGGSTLRGCLGHGLRQRFCVMPVGHPCKECPRRTACRYSQLFEPVTPLALQGRYNDVPPPWVLEPEWHEPQVLAPEQKFSCRMNLFGPGLTLLSDLIGGFDQGVRRGIGKGMGRARVAEVLVEEDGQWAPLAATGRTLPRSLSVTRWPDETATTASVGIEVMTPARLQAGGRIQGPGGWDARLLLNAVWRRVQLYDQCYLGGALPDRRPPVDGVLLTGALKVVHWQRYSNRQGRPIRMDGVTGRLKLRELPAAWLPWLTLGQWTHLGKNTGFGLGQYRITGVSLKGSEDTGEYR